ncbi:MAG: DUF945 family protein [Lautropia sp.]|nr:DUF945 family protein [Lautropia sp.]
MNRIVGITALTCIALGGAYTAGSWWLGQRIENHYRQHLDRIALRLGTDKVLERSYERGVFGSRSKLVLALKLPLPPFASGPDLDTYIPEAAVSGPSSGGIEAPVPETMNETLDHGTDETKAGTDSGETAPIQTTTIHIHLVQDLRHGPVVDWRLAAVATRTRITRIDGIDDAIRRSFAKARLPVLHTVHRFDRGIDGRFVLPAGELLPAGAPDGRVHWQALSYRFDLDASRARLTGTTSWPLLSADLVQRAEDGSIQRAQVTMAGLQGRHESNVKDRQWLMIPGTQTGKLDRLDILISTPGRRGTDFRMELADILFDHRTTKQEQLLSMSRRIGARGRIGNTLLDRVQLDTELKRIDGTVLAQLQSLVAHWLTTDSPEDDQPREADFAQMLNSLLADGPELKESIGITLGGDTARFDYGVRLNPAVSAVSEELPLQMQLTQRTQTTASLHLPRSWSRKMAEIIDDPEMSAESLSNMADFFAMQGFLQHENDGWSAHAELNHGEVKLNGKTLFDAGSLDMTGQ